MGDKPTNGENKNDSFPDVTPEEMAEVADKIREGELLQPKDLDIIMRKTAQDMREYAKAKQEGGREASPIEHVGKIIGVDTSALAGYFFTSYGVFQKDLNNKTNPYIAFTVALIHALNLGYFLGKLNRKENHGSKDTIN